MSKLADQVFNVKFTNQEEEDKFLADLATELICDHTDYVMDELISVQKHMIKFKNNRTGLFYFVYLYKVVEHTEDGQYFYKTLSFDFYMLLTKKIQLKLSNFYNYYARRYDVSYFSELISKILFTDNKQTFHLRFVSVSDHSTKFNIENDHLCQYNYYDAELLSKQNLTFVEFEILFKCSILHEHANHFLLDYMPEYFGPQQKMPSNEALIATLTLIDMLMFDEYSVLDYVV